MRRLAVLAIAAGCVVASGCGSGDRADVSRLERQLLKTGFSVCDGACHTYRRTEARCERRGVGKGGLELHRCRLASKDAETGRAGPRETVCAGLDPGSPGGYAARPLSDCRKEP